MGRGLGLPACGSSAGTTKSCSVSPIDGAVGGESGGVSTLAVASHSMFKRSTKFSTSGEEGSEGDKSYQLPGASSLSEGILLNFRIFTFNALAALLRFRVLFGNLALGRPVQLFRSVCLIFMPILEIQI